MQTLLLDHFQREQELMNSLPRNPAVKIHCERHRREHVSFSTRYNLAAAQLSTCQPAIAAREIEVLVFDWIRSHALEFDAKLAELLHRPVEGAYR
jgi:hemerythrin